MSRKLEHKTFREKEGCNVVQQTSSSKKNCKIDCKANGLWLVAFKALQNPANTTINEITFYVSVCVGVVAERWPKSS